MVSVSLQDWLRTGDFGPLRFGMSTDKVRDLLGPPTDTNLNTRSRSMSSIWKYGDVELHFSDDDSLQLIYLDHFSTPSGGGQLVLDPWIIGGGLAIEQVKEALEEAGIGYRREDWQHDHNAMRIVVGPLVWLMFVEREDPYSPPPGLFSISCAATP